MVFTHERKEVEPVQTQKPKAIKLFYGVSDLIVVQIRYHFGGCDDHNACTGSDACSADPHKLGMCQGLPRFCEPCSECDMSTGDCVSDCEAGEICVNDKCEDAPPAPECHYDQDCPFPECQGCDAGGHCVGTPLYSIATFSLCKNATK